MVFDLHESEANHSGFRFTVWNRTGQTTAQISPPTKCPSNDGEHPFYTQLQTPEWSANCTHLFSTLEIVHSCWGVYKQRKFLQQHSFKFQVLIRPSDRTQKQFNHYGSHNRTRTNLSRWLQLLARRAPAAKTKLCSKPQIYKHISSNVM